MRMNMSDFATFFAVARNQSFRAAGDELGLSSSAISHSIKTLEQRLKIRLFNRTTRSVSLTEAGSNLYERLRPAFDEIQIMLDEMNDFRLTPTGTLKINAARVAARIFLMSLLVGFTREYPDIKVELTTDDSLVDIVQQGFDAGVRLSCIVEKDMISVAIGPPMKLCVAATPEYFARYGKPRHPHDCVFRSIRSRIGIEVRSAIRIHSINRELNFFYRFLTRFFAAFHCRGIFPQGLSLKDHSV